MTIKLQIGKTSVKEFFSALFPAGSTAPDNSPLHEKGRKIYTYFHIEEGQSIEI